MAKIYKFNHSIGGIIWIGKNYLVNIPDNISYLIYIRMSELLHDTVPKSRIGPHMIYDLLGDFVLADHQHPMRPQAAADRQPALKPPHYPASQRNENNPHNPRA